MQQLGKMQLAVLGQAYCSLYGAMPDRCCMMGGSWHMAMANKMKMGKKHTLLLTSCLTGKSIIMGNAQCYTRHYEVTIQGTQVTPTRKKLVVFFNDQNTYTKQVVWPLKKKFHCKNI